MGDKPTTKCRFTWCDGQHHVTPGHIHHQRVVGTAAVQGDPLTVSIEFRESRGAWPGLGPSVAVRWPHIEGDGTNEGQPFGLEGIDLMAPEALALGELLIDATALLNSVTGCSSSLPRCPGWCRVDHSNGIDVEHESTLDVVAASQEPQGGEVIAQLLQVPGQSPRLLLGLCERLECDASMELTLDEAARMVERLQFFIANTAAGDQ